MEELNKVNEMSIVSLMVEVPLKKDRAEVKGPEGPDLL